MTRLTADDLARRARLQEVIDRQDAERGVPLTEQEKMLNLLAALHRCDRCEKSIELKWRFCAWCGYDL